MGQCYKCGEKWSHQHKCIATVQLHVVQELWELFQLSMEDPILPETSKLCMVISQAAITSQITPKTLKLLGCIQSSQIFILVDSGSTHTFISATLASKLTSGSSVLASLTVMVTNWFVRRNLLICNGLFSHTPFLQTSKFYHYSIMI